MFTAAELWGYRPEGSNPCRHVKRFREERRQRFLSDEEYRRLGAVLREAESTGMVAASAVAAIRLLMLTGCRLSEIPDPALGERRSGGGGATAARQQDWSQGRAPRCACGRRAASYCPRGGQPLGDHRTSARESRRLPAFPLGAYPQTRRNSDDVRLHDLRHSFASGGLLVGEGLPMIGKLLGHSQVQTTARYAHLADDPVKAAADRIASRIARVAG